MFLRTKKRTGPSGIKYEYLYLVENYRKNGKVVQRTIASFGQTKDPSTKQKINALIKTLMGKFSDYENFNVGSHIGCLAGQEYGPLLIFKRLWKDLGLEKILKDTFKTTETFYDISDVIFNIILSRLTSPCSKRGMQDYQKKIYDLPQFDMHQYFRSMDYLVESKDEIEKKIFNQMLQSTGGKLDMAFFDTTTIVYYGDGSDEISKILAKGYSKDHRGYLNQVVVGVIMNKEGIPFAHEVFAGNKNDVTCFKEVVETLKNKYNIKKVILVGDRGMISMKNLELLEKNKLDYILGFRMRTISKESREEVLKKVNLTKLRKLGGLQAREADYRGKRILVYYDEKRAEEDKAHREKIIAELKEKTKNATIHTVVSNINYKRYLDIEGKKPKLSQKKIKLDELYDGTFTITTNTKLSANQVVNSYRHLWHVEQGFRWLKSELELGPIYHWKDKRIQAHVLICFISLILKVFLNKKLKEYDAKASYPESLSALKSLQVIKMKIKEKAVHLLTDLQPEGKTVFNAINMRVPEKIVYDEYSQSKSVVENILV